MLHLVIAGAIVVGCWHQWILPERRRKAEAALVFRHLHPTDRDATPAGQRELRRLWRRAGLPPVPKPPSEALSRVTWPAFCQNGNARFEVVVGGLCALLVIASAWL